MTKLSNFEIEWRAVNYLINQGPLEATSIGPAPIEENFYETIAREIGVPKISAYQVLDKMRREGIIHKYKSGEAMMIDKTRFDLTVDAFLHLNKKSDPKKTPEKS